MTLWSHFCCVGYGIQARWDAVGHRLRGHDLRWRTNIDPWSGCLGDIECWKCPDSTTGESDVVFWCRYNLVWSWIAQVVCGRLGHPELRHPQKHVGWDEATDTGIYEDVLTEWYCYRCGAHVAK